MANANDPISQREDVRHQVIEVATKAFHSRGIKNVTMDDIAHSLTMSKRTLYQLFSDKEDLLLACAQQRDAHEEARVEELMQKSNSVFDFLLATFAVKMHEMEHIHPSFFAEMLKFPALCSTSNNRVGSVKLQLLNFSIRERNRVISAAM